MRISLFAKDVGNLSFCLFFNFIRINYSGISFTLNFDNNSSFLAAKKATIKNTQPFAAITLFFMILLVYEILYVADIVTISF